MAQQAGYIQINLDYFEFKGYKMIRKLLFFYTFFLFCISLYAVDLTSLDKYCWIEKIPESRGGYTHFIKLEKLPSEYEIYKMKYHNRKTNNILFFVFYYNYIENKYYEVENLMNGKSNIPLYKFNNLDLYVKTEGNETSLEGKYYSDIEEFDEIEIKKVARRDYLYCVTLDYEAKGMHLLYLDEIKLKSDNTFGLIKEEAIEKLFQVDRSDSFYLNRNIISSYTSDDFTITIVDENDFNIKLKKCSEKGETYLIPEALYINQYVYLYQNAEIFDDNFNFIRNQNSYKEKVQIVDKKNEWFERNGLLTLFLKVKFSDGTTGWIYSDQFIIF